MRSTASMSPAQGRMWVDSYLLTLFMVGLFLPVYVEFGSVRLSFYRLILLVGFIYFLFSGKLFRIDFKVFDFLVFSICIWSTVSFVVLYGSSTDLENIGLVWVDTLCPWIFARLLVTNSRRYEQFVCIFVICLLFFAPFVVAESFTKQPILLNFLGSYLDSFSPVWAEERWGLRRAQGTFPHPIHLGVIYFSAVSLVWSLSFGTGRRFLHMNLVLAVASVGVFSLSSGPLAMLTAQLYLFAWFFIFRNWRYRWRFLLFLVAFAYVFIDTFSSRTPFHVFASYFSFNAQTAYSRINIWIWGTKSIRNNPIFGIGFEDWERLPFMTASVDMFWIAPAMQNGALIGFLWISLFLLIVVRVAMSSGQAAENPRLRLGYVFCMVGFFIVGWTVHFWANTYVWFVFLLGAGLWYLQPKSVADVPGRDVLSEERKVLYSRF